MPIKTCNEDGRPGYKWGDKGRCYTYKAGSESAKKSAKKKAIKQGVAIEGPENFKAKASKEELSNLAAGDRLLVELEAKANELR
jgi:hypothetical protein